MVKNELIVKKLLKGCYGTDEWSENSGICKNCKLKYDCGKINKNKDYWWIISSEMSGKQTL